MKKLTGQTRFRAAEVIQTGLIPTQGLVWQVQTVEYALRPNGSFEQMVEWRDAQVEDLCEINHIVYSTINVRVMLPQFEDGSLPGEKVDARKLH